MTTPASSSYQELHDKERASASSYSATLTEYVKWTTTITLAAVAWIANSLTSSTTTLRAFSIVSLLLLIISLIFAVISLKRILDATSNEWDISSSFQSRVLLELLEKSGADPDFVRRRREQLDKVYFPSLEASDKYHVPRFFNKPVTAHVSLLATGITAYTIGQVLSVLFN